jgi:hypothetical protein
MTESSSLAPVIPLPIAATAPRGRHGMTARRLTKYSAQDWITWGRIGGVADHDYRIVEVAPWSPAWNADIRSGDWVLTVDGIGFDLFERRGAPAGRCIIVVTHRPGLGTRSIQIVLAPPARPKPPTKQRRPDYPQIACGAHLLGKKQRPMWQTAMQDDPALIGRDRDVAARIATKYADDANMAWPSIVKLARDLRISESSVKRAIRRLHHRGWLKVMSGRCTGSVNHYWLTWPAGRSIG